MIKILKDETYLKLLSEQDDLKSKLAKAQEELEARRKIEIDGKGVIVTPGASSSKDLPNSFDYLNKSLRVIKPDFDFDCIVQIRKLCKINPDFSQVINDLVRLANTGHKIKFDPKVGEAEVEKMRKFIFNSAKNWHVGSAGISGVVNKMFRQAFQAGAISNEWVPNAALDDIDELRFVNPENVRVVVEKNTKGYQFYQKIRNKPIQAFNIKDLKKLNPLQYKYFALNGDTDLPYGIPPFMAALDATGTQKHIMDNIKFVTEYLGVMGFLDVLVAKPPQKPGEADTNYMSRLNQFLTDTKDRVLKARRDGVMVGFQEEVETTFSSVTKDAKGVVDIHALNENLIASGLGTDPVFMGRPGASETLVTVMFTKMIAQLKNIQEIVRENLEFGYRLLLTLGGFKFDSIIVEFNPSTITDDLKFQQAQEIKVRNLVILFHYGIINLEQFADALGYISADQKNPRIDINNTDPMTGEVKKQKREEDKDKSARKSRDKKNPRGTVRKQNNSSKPKFPNKSQQHEAKIIRIN